MTLLEKYYYEAIEIENIKESDEILDMLTPLSPNLALKVDELLGTIISQSGLEGFKKGFELAKSLGVGGGINRKIF